jgi:hypothetical protein
MLADHLLKHSRMLKVARLRLSSRLLRSWRLLSLVVLATQRTEPNDKTRCHPESPKDGSPEELPRMPVEDP